MKSANFWIYLLVMFIVTYFIRVLPFIVFHKKIENKLPEDIKIYFNNNIELIKERYN